MYNSIVASDAHALTSLPIIKNQGLTYAMSIAEAQALGARLLRDIGIDTPDLDMRLILCHVLRCDELNIFLRRQHFLTHDQWDELVSLLKRRLCYEPMAYIRGVKEFFGYDFFVNADCLIPRPDTECIVEHCLKIMDPVPQPVVFDVATGSGAIGIVLLKKRPDMHVVASDLSKAALSLAARNSAKLEVSERLDLIHGDLFEPFRNFRPKRLAHLIVSNPPYIRTADFKALESEVKNYEPAMALLAGDEKGLAFYYRLLKEAHEFLQPKGYLVLEVGFDQSQQVADLAGKLWRFVAIHCDLAGRPRVVVMQKEEDL